MENPFKPILSKAERKFQQDLSRWRQMAQATGSPADRAVLATQPRSVIELIGPRVEKEFALKTRNSGELYPIEEKDFSGRDVTRFYGDIAKAYETCTLPPVKIKLAETVWHRGLPYLKSQLPAWVQAERALAQIGTRPERGAPVGSGE